MTTDIAASFPDVDLAPGSTITVETGDPLAVIEFVNVYTTSPERAEPEVLPPVPVLLGWSPEPAAA